jgi:hypothetical protein
MPRFYYHVRNGFGFAEDEEGVELADLEAAKQHAIEGARSLRSADVAEGELDLRGRIEITDAAGACVLVLPFRDALRIRDGELPGQQATRKIR